MKHDLGELGRVGRLLSEVLGLLEGERRRLEERYGPNPGGDHSAGGPMQTMHGIRDLCEGVRRALKGVALGVGYISLGLDAEADHAVRMVRKGMLAVPSGVDRMARPLGEDVVRALERLRDLDGFFDGDLALEVDVALAAPQATYPPDDWAEYDRQRRTRPD
ncbi:hypothetical protein C9F11_01575 [Streptomyces sp. YIM 121038]|uniref:hypothetical protein n=1 Tax=unclassified Streptomyces TaxID=2593676 RepID=UPI001110B97B|nr:MULTISPECIES: hypothetical protein [unclassified Streptomyces]QCX74018.1 hypothetical protein C9F11_01575 [Streptomyces sp. YIM 121038]